MIGSTWPTLVTARLLAGFALDIEGAVNQDITLSFGKFGKAWRSASIKLNKEVSWSLRFGPGCEVPLHHFRSAEVVRKALAVREELDRCHKVMDEQLLAILVGRCASHQGIDVKIEMGLAFVATDFARRCIDPTLLRWWPHTAARRHCSPRHFQEAPEEPRQHEEEEHFARGQPSCGGHHGNRPQQLTADPMHSPTAHGWPACWQPPLLGGVGETE